MRIRIQSEEHQFTVLLPTGLVFSKATVWLANHFGRKYAGDAMKDIPPEAMDALFAEFRRIKKKHGTWELADIESAGGERVKVVL